MPQPITELRVSSGDELIAIVSASMDGIHGWNPLMESMMASMDGMRGWHPWMAAMDKFLVGGKASKSIVEIASKAADAYDWGQCLLDRSCS
jgi:hypothetical protein